MRNIRVATLIQRINYLGTGSNLLNKTSYRGAFKFHRDQNNFENGSGNSSYTYSKRYSSSGSHGSSSDFTRTSIIYTLFGAAIFGGAIGVYQSSQTGKKSSRNLVSAASQPVSSSEEAPAEEPVVESEPEPETLSSQEPLEQNESQPEAVQSESDQPEAVQSESNQSEASEPEASQENVEQPAEQNNEEQPVAPKEEKILPDIPPHAQYLIVGGGTAAMAAFKSIRANDANARVLVITEENYKPYMRPPLSKDLWMTDDEKLVEQLRFKQYNGNERSLFFLEDEFYVEPKYLNEQEFGGVAVLTGKRVVEVDAQNKSVRLDDGTLVAYDKCLIATGGKPKNLSAFENSESLREKVTLFRNIEDFKNLYKIAREGKTIAIIGGGFLGSELACALANVSRKYGGSVVQLFPESGNLHKILPNYLSEWTTKRINEEGVSVVPGVKVENAKLNDNKVELQLESVSGKNLPISKWLLADHVVVAVGLEPNVQLAKSGFEIDSKLGGYVVNAELQARNSIWVAGDAACFYDIKLGRRRVEHHDHAVVSGRLAGDNMTGAGKPYWHQSMFWSDLGPKIGFEAIGLVDSSLPTVGLFAKADESDTPQAVVNQTNEAIRSEVKGEEQKVVENLNPEPRKPFANDEFGKGVVLYLKDGVLVGALFWNLFNRIPIARKLIQSQEKITDYKELAKLFKIDASGLEESGN